MKIAIHSDLMSAKVIGELLSPWDVSFTSIDEADLTIVYKRKLTEGTKSIIIPSVCARALIPGSTSLTENTDSRNRRIIKEPGKTISIAIDSQTSLTFTPIARYYYNDLSSVPEDHNFPVIDVTDDLILLTIDIVDEYKAILDSAIKAKPSATYRLVTNSPIPYGIVPTKFRDILMKKRVGRISPNLDGKLSFDCLRFVLVNSLERLTRKKLSKKTWKGRRYACVITHDVDTREGLQRSEFLRKIEEKYDISSAWFIPSKHYSLDQGLIKDMAHRGEVGAHDTKHDGKLGYLSRTVLSSRFKEAKRDLERITGQPVEGFRSPLLQHNSAILQAVGDSGYSYDSSIPTWEPKHPITMKSHGIQTIYPVCFGRVKELPVTLPQDHQMLHVLGVHPKEVVELWVQMMGTIKKMGGLASFLIHPDYEMANPDNLSVYEELLNNIVSEKEVLTDLPRNVALDCKSV